MELRAQQLQTVEEASRSQATDYKRQRTAASDNYRAEKEREVARLQQAATAASSVLDCTREQLDRANSKNEALVSDLKLRAQQLRSAEEVSRGRAADYERLLILVGSQNMQLVLLNDKLALAEQNAVLVIDEPVYVPGKFVKQPIGMSVAFHFIN